MIFLFSVITAACLFHTAAPVSSNQTGTDSPQTGAIQAESAEVASPAGVIEDDLADGGRCVRLSEENAPSRLYSSTELEHARGQVTFSLDVESEAVYAIWARVQWHCICSRRIAIQTSAPSVESADQANVDDNGILSSGYRPHAWHWLRVGSYRLSRDRQTITFVQAGHMALLDAIAFSSDPAFRPLGHKGQDERVTIPHLPEDWNTGAQDEETYPLSDQIWDDFRLSLSMRVPSPTLARPSIGLAFCSAPSGTRYEVQIEGDEQGLFRFGLLRNHKGGIQKLQEQSRAYGVSSYHSLAVTRMSERIAVLFDGNPILDVSDFAFRAGGIALLSGDTRDVYVEDIAIDTLTDYKDVFADGEGAWKALSGTWQTARPEEHSADGNVYLGRASDLALAAAPCQFAEDFAVETRLLLAGSDFAGIAVDIRDPNDFSAVVVGQDPANTAGRTLTASVLRISNGKCKAIWKRPIESTEDQWQVVAIRRGLASLGVQVNGHELGTLLLSQSASPLQLGLVVGGNGAASFGGFSAHTENTPDLASYSFEPEVDVQSASVFQVLKGSIELREHPGRLLVSGDAKDDDAILQYRCPLPEDFEIDLDLAWQQTISEDKASDPFASLGIAKLVLPDDPKVGLEFTTDSARQKYAVMADAGTMSEVCARIGEEQVARKVVDKSVGADARTLRITVCRGEINVMCAGTQALRVPIDVDGEKGRKWTASIRAENVDASHPIAIRGVTVRKFRTSSTED